MSFEFDLSELALDRACKNAQNIIEQLRASLKDGSGRTPESLKLYNRYYDGLSITAKQYAEDKDIQDEVEHTVLMILATKWQIDRIFDIDIEEKHAAQVTDPLFYNNELEEELEKRVEYYNMVLNIIQTAHNLTDEKISHTKETLEALGIDIPKELELAEYVRSNYAKNQRRKALKNALKDIFPQINNKIILNEITSKALA